MSSLQSLHVFCHVVDNFGDIGVCWRVSRQCAAEHGLTVTLWIDDLVSFQRICPPVDITLAHQVIAGVSIRHWNMSAADLPEVPADIVVEGFGCTLPAAYVQQMTTREVPPVWFNLEYLSAENWVEDCHGMVSVHPSLPLKKIFFFPGFTAKTGGLPCEAGLLEARDAFMADPLKRQAFLQSIGVPCVPDARYLSLFCYPDAPVSALFDALANKSPAPVYCLIPEGVAQAAVAAWTDQQMTVGQEYVRGQLHLVVIPFIEQSQYDQLLWSCDMNFVRGEDSFVRAQWAGKPLVWHIYPQEENVHLEKLNAFIDLYAASLPKALAAQVRSLWLSWNTRFAHEAVTFPDLLTGGRDGDKWQKHARAWSDHLKENGDLAANLISFAQKIG